MLLRLWNIGLLYITNWHNSWLWQIFSLLLQRLDTLAEAWPKVADTMPSTVGLYPSMLACNACLTNTLYVFALDVWLKHKKAKEPSKFQTSIAILMLSLNSREWKSGLLAKSGRGKNTERYKMCMKHISFKRNVQLFPIWLLLSSSVKSQ